SNRFSAESSDWTLAERPRRFCYVTTFSSRITCLAAVVTATCCTKPIAPTNQPPKTTESERHARGLNPPTEEERARLDAMAQKDPSQTPNALARERLNAERKAKGLPPLPPESPTSA